MHVLPAEGEREGRAEGVRHLGERRGRERGVVYDAAVV